MPQSADKIRSDLAAKCSRCDLQFLLVLPQHDFRFLLQRGKVFARFVLQLREQSDELGWIRDIVAARIFALPHRKASADAVQCEAGNGSGFLPGSTSSGFADDASGRPRRRHRLGVTRS
jgi:hypothetical protein